MFRTLKLSIIYKKYTYEIALFDVFILQLEATFTKNEYLHKYDTRFASHIECFHSVPWDNNSENTQN